MAAALLGGVTVAWTESPSVAGRPVHRAVRLEPAPGLHPVVFIPEVSLSTRTARGLLPERVPHADAAFNAGRAALLVEALTRRPDLLLPATEDRLHQGYRAEAMGESARLLARLRAAGVPAVVSGAGPTVLAVCDERQAADLVRSAPAGFHARRLGVDPSGAVVRIG